MRFAALIAGCVHGKWKLEYHVVWHLTSLRQATELHRGNDMKNILYIWFSHFTLTETHRCQNYSLSLYQKKKNLPRWPIYLFTGNESKPPLKLSDCGRKIRNDVYTDSYYCKPKLVTRIMTITQHNSVLHAFSVPNWSEICGVVDVLTVPQLSPTGKFRSIYAKVWCTSSVGNTKNDHVATSTCLEWQLKYVKPVSQ